MKQIGHLAGVSQSTVSRVLSGAASIVPVADDTRARILQVVADSGYSPNPLARALRGARTGLLGLIVRDIGDPFFGMAIAAITAIARDSGYNVVFVPFAQDKPAGKPVEVLNGFVNAQGHAYGRPVGVAIDKTGALLVADDVGNTIWRVSAS